ncbi:hypothetical protein D3C76_1571320 [compost metagenome]
MVVTHDLRSLNQRHLVYYRRLRGERSAVGPQMRQAACEARVVGNHRPTFAARQQLAMLHRKGTCRAEATNMPTGVAGAMCLGAIFD